MPIQFSCPECGKKVRAPDEVAGRKCRCPHCKAVIQAPAGRVVEAEEVAQEDAPPQLQQDSGLLEEVEARRPCPACGEQIVATALKCRFCGEVFDEDLRRVEKRKKKKKRSSAEDDDPSTGDWVACFLCPGIACIFGVVYMIQGKPKGWKMVLTSVLMQVVWGAIRFAIIEASK